MSKKDKEEKKAEEAKPVGDKVDSVSSVASDSSDTKGIKDAKTETDAKGAKAEDKQSSSAKAAEDNQAPAEPDWKNLYAVTLADFDNYKKRAARDREDVYRYAESDILKDILPTVDHLALALKSGEETASPLSDKGKEFVKGVQLVYDGLLKALADHGAKPMADLVGKELDPNFHEAIATLPDEKIEEGKISNVAKVGWLLNDKLLRAAQVVVSAGKGT